MKTAQNESFIVTSYYYVFFLSGKVLQFRWSAYLMCDFNHIYTAKLLADSFLNLYLYKMFTLICENVNTVQYFYN